MDQDKRFEHIVSDPKFRRIPKAERKVKIDKRFKSMFNDEKFKLKYTVDKRGRPVNHTTKEDLKRYYDLQSDSESSSDDEDFQNSDIEETQELNIKHSDETNIPDKIKTKLKDLSVDYARGEAALESESSNDSESEVSDDEDIEHGWGELDKDAERTDEITNRLAVCNMDWDRIRAVDLMVLFNSFLTPGGVIHSITIYPSDFGLQRMKEEEISGPIELVENKTKDDDSEGSEGEEGSKYHMEKLRQYQLNRLKYYYAVVVCDSMETANKIYSECDGLEYESSATKIDLRFIPEDVIFENEPKETCDKIPERYQPRSFTTTALQQAKVQLTWDETNVDRQEITKKLISGKIDDVTEADLHAYLATSSDEESEQENSKLNSNDEDDTTNPIDKYRKLLQEIENSEKKKDGVEMEVTWGLDLKEKTEKLVKKKMEENIPKTPFQQLLDKKREKRKAKREKLKNKQNETDENDDSDDIPSDVDMNDPYFAEEFNKPEFKQQKKKKVKEEDDEDTSDQDRKKAELELLLMDENDDGKKHFSLKDIVEKDNNKKKRKKKKQKGSEPEVKASNDDDFQLNVNDDRFSALYSSHHFNIDPTDPHYRKTKGMAAIIEEKFKRRLPENNSDSTISNDNEKKRKKNDVELNMLVKSVKRKTNEILRKK